MKAHPGVLVQSFRQPVSSAGYVVLSLLRPVTNASSRIRNCSPLEAVAGRVKVATQTEVVVELVAVTVWVLTGFCQYVEVHIGSQAISRRPPGGTHQMW